MIVSLPRVNAGASKEYQRPSKPRKCAYYADCARSTLFTLRQCSRQGPRGDTDTQKPAEDCAKQRDSVLQTRRIAQADVETAAQRAEEYPEGKQMCKNTRGLPYKRESHPSRSAEAAMEMMPRAGHRLRSRSPPRPAHGRSGEAQPRNGTPCPPRENGGAWQPQRPCSTPPRTPPFHRAWNL